MHAQADRLNAACNSRRHKRRAAFPQELLESLLLQIERALEPQPVQENVPFSRVLQTSSLLGTLETDMRLGGWQAATGDKVESIVPEETVRATNHLGEIYIVP